MIRTMDRPLSTRLIYAAYIAVFLLYLAAPLAVVGAFAFNDSLFPALPWKGFTLDWFIGTESPKIGLFHERGLLEAIGVSFGVATAVAVISVALGTANAFLFERHDFRFKGVAYMLMLAPLVIPGVILGIALLVAANRLANGLWDVFDLDIEALRPGLVLVVLGQVSFIATIATLIVSARLRRFDRSLEEAALNLGASKWAAIRTITLPFLAPAMAGAAVTAFLMSFENFNTTLMLVGSDAPLSIALFDRLKEGSTPVLNAISLALMVVSGLLAGMLMLGKQRQE